MTKTQNPYRGPTADGYNAYHAGKSRESNPEIGLSKKQRWDSGWIKAKLAKEQGKRAL